jgi:two-component system response regulator HydG
MPPTRQPRRVLIVDSERAFLEPLLAVLRVDHDVRTVSCAAGALRAVKDFAPHVVLLDMKLPDANSLDCLKRIKQEFPDVEVMMVAALGEVASAVAAIKLGACDYVQKPVGLDVIEKALRRPCGKMRGQANGSRTASREATYPLPPDHDPYEIVGTSAAVNGVLAVIEQVCRTDLNVLIQGESGTGKELVARSIHRGSRRQSGPFVAVNCALFSGDLIDSNLFGHEKGAFTGATSRRRGVFELADGGTLLLDEIGTMPLITQSKLLRVLEEKRFTRVGGERPVEVDVRLIFATNRDLETETEMGNFREDLFYRINVVSISVPPLRSRREDIPLLVEHFLRKHSRFVDSPLRSLTPEAIGELQSRTWRGNVRQLENIIQMLMSLSMKSAMGLEDIEALTPSRPSATSLRIHEPPEPHAPPERLQSGIDRQTILATLEACDWNRTLASSRLGIHRNTLRNMMKRFGIRARLVAE